RWAQTDDRDLADVFAIQSEIAVQIATQLQAKLSPKIKSAIEERPTKDLAAYDLYVRAKLLVMTPLIGAENLLEAARLLDQAIARDPDFFLAYCLLSEAHSRLYAIFDHTPVRRATMKKPWSSILATCLLSGSSRSLTYQCVVLLRGPPLWIAQSRWLRRMADRG